MTDMAQSIFQRLASEAEEREASPWGKVRPRHSIIHDRYCRKPCCKPALRDAETAGYVRLRRRVIYAVTGLLLLTGYIVAVCLAGRI